MSDASVAAPDFVIARKHRWGDPVWTPGMENHDGNDRTERACIFCGLVKITVHPPSGLPWREWRTKDGMVAQLTATPPCLAEAGT